jgi:hypothetical protein
MADIPILSPGFRRPKFYVSVDFADTLRTLARDLFDPYRPELHYMRGPGPKWHAKHGKVAEPAAEAALVKAAA